MNLWKSVSGSVAVSNKSKSVRMVLKPNEIAIYNKVEENKGESGNCLSTVGGIARGLSAS